MLPAARQFDCLSIDQFEEELRRFTHSRPMIPVADPLGHAVKLIEQNPAHSGSRLLLRILSALSGRHAEFRYAEVGSLDTGAISLVMQLIEARRSGTTAPEAWRQAADRAGACDGAA